MPIYETVFMSRQDLTEKQVQDLTDKYSDVIKKESGKILKTEQWGVRTLAYKINKAKKANYTLLEFEAPGSLIAELDRLMRIDEDVMRQMTITLDEPTNGPSPMVRKEYDNDDSKDDSKDKKEAA